AMVRYVSGTLISWPARVASWARCRWRHDGLLDLRLQFILAFGMMVCQNLLAVLLGRSKMQICVRLFLSLLAAVIVGASGCAYSTRPLSDAKTSTADARLLGTWEIADTDKPAEKKIVVVDRKKDEPNVLRLFDIQEKKTADVFLTKIGERYVASIADEE